jgi:hypothetical protein
MLIGLRHRSQGAGGAASAVPRCARGTELRRCCSADSMCPGAHVGDGKRPQSSTQHDVRASICAISWKSPFRHAGDVAKAMYPAWRNLGAPRPRHCAPQGRPASHSEPARLPRSGSAVPWAAPRRQARAALSAAVHVSAQRPCWGAGRATARPFRCRDATATHPGRLRRAQRGVCCRNATADRVSVPYVGDSGGGMGAQPPCSERSERGTILAR